MTKLKIEDYNNVNRLEQLQVTNSEIRSKTTACFIDYLAILHQFDFSLDSLGQQKIGFEKLSNSIVGLLKDKEELLSEIKTIKSNMTSMEMKNEKSKQDFSEMQKKLRDLESEMMEFKSCETETADKIAAHILNESRLAKELIQCKIALAEARTIRKKFRLRRVWMLSTTLCFMYIVKPSFEYAIKIQDSSSSFLLKFSEIDSIFLHPVKKSHFFLKSTRNTIQEYFSECSEEIVSLIRELMFSEICGERVEKLF